MATKNGTAVDIKTSDLNLNPAAFLGLPPAQAAESNKKLIAMSKKVPNWWDVGAAKYRAMRERGETLLPKPELVPDAQDLPFQSRDAGRTINCRLIVPDGQQRGQQPGIFLHIHGGGWVTMSEKFQDPFLKSIVNATGLAALSVGYRLAPEDPFPAGPNDCYDVAEYLVDHAEKEFGAPLMFVGGESAGGHLSSLVVLHLLEVRPSFRLRGAILTYGCYNLSVQFPSRRNFHYPLVLSPETMDQYFKAFVPNLTHEQRADPAISPYWHPIFYIDDTSQEGKAQAGLPPALFLCGTMDPLLDDSVFMAARWQMTGAEGTLKIFRGLPHGFNMFPDAMFPGSDACNHIQMEWMKSKM